MKRRIHIFLLVLILILLTVFISGCGSNMKPKYIEKTIESGKYLLYETNDGNRYLQFLDSFDNEKYEIVDISYGRNDYIDESDKSELFVVTYHYK